MTPNEYQLLAKRTECPQDAAFSRIVEHRVPAMALLHSVVGMMGELGELAGCLEKWIWYGQKFDGVNFKEELGDMNWYEAEALNALQEKFETVLNKNIEKLRKRYPDKYTDEAAKEENRDRAVERKVLEELARPHDDSAPDPPIEGGYSGFSPKTELKALVEQALALGWRVNRDQPGSSCLIPPVNHPANHWAANWNRTATLDGCVLVVVPSYLEKVLTEQLRGISYPKPPIKRGGSEERIQTGQGFAEPPEEVEVSLASVAKEDFALAASFGDGLNRDKLNHSYNRFCKVCHKNVVHTANSTQTCPDCMADIKAGRVQTDAKN